MIRKFALLLALVFAFSVAQSALAQNNNLKSGRHAETRAERGEDRRQGTKHHRRHRRGHRRHSSNGNGNMNH